MIISNKNNCTPIIGAASEKIYELIRAENTPDSSLAYLELLPNTSSPKHYHPSTMEIYYVLSGKAQMLIDGEIREIVKNDSILIKEVPTLPLF